MSRSPMKMPMPRRSAIALAAGEGELVVLYREEDMPGAPPRIELERLRGRPFISLANSGDRPAVRLEECARLELDLDEVISARTFYIATALVAQGVGMTVVDNFTFQQASAGATAGDAAPLRPQLTFDDARDVPAQPARAHRARPGRLFLKTLAKVIDTPQRWLAMPRRALATRGAGCGRIALSPNDTGTLTSSTSVTAPISWASRLRAALPEFRRGDCVGEFRHDDSPLTLGLPRMTIEQGAAAAPRTLVLGTANSGAARWAPIWRATRGGAGRGDEHRRRPAPAARDVP